jgi:uracil-DNA glycosylase
MARHLLEEHLRQRTELGERELVLERFRPAELIAALTGGAGRAERVVPAPTTRSVPAQAPAAGPALVRIGSLDALRERASGCTACALAATRTNVVFGEGAPDADLLVVGEAPGADEDASGRPFVGRAGRLLTLMLAAVGFSRDAVYICNVLKCRPPGNRNPQEAEVAACSGYLHSQLDLVAPRAILACGTFAAQTLLETAEPIGRLRGRAHGYRGIPLVPTYHPAALLRNSGWVRPAWEDLQRVRQLLDTR